MSTEIKYKNLFGDELTSQQVLLFSDDYQMEQYVGGELKRIDYYQNNQMNSGTYYLSLEEDLQTVLTELQSVWNNGYFYIGQQTVGNYTVRDWEVYEGLTKLYKGKTIYDNQNREIAEQTLDINTLEVTKTTKRYYLQTFGQFTNSDDIPNFGIIDFNYNNPSLATAEISVDIHLSGFDHKSYIINGQQNILLSPEIATVFLWSDQTYYQSASPFIPA